MGRKFYILILVFLVLPLPMSGQDGNDPVRVPVLAFRSNLLLPLMNIGVEVPLTDYVSIEADFYSPWLPREVFDSNPSGYRYCIQTLAGAVGCRYWPGDTHRGRSGGGHRLCGHSIGFVASGGIYDFEWDWNGQQGEFVFIGADYLYALPVGRGGVRFEFNLGVGFGVNWYNNYYVQSGNARLLDDGGPQFRHLSAPIRLGISLVLPVFRSARAGEMEDDGYE